MKNYIALALLATTALASIAPSQADEWRHAARNERRADRQEYKSQRDLMRGDIEGADRHAMKAQREEFRASRDRNRALRGF